MAFFTKGIVISFVAGIAGFAANGLVEDSDSAAEEDSVTLEELEKQKEHLEDLIADQQAKAGAASSGAAAS